MHVDHHCISGCMAFTWKYGNIVARCFFFMVGVFDAYGHRYFWDEFTRARAQTGNYASRKVVSLGHNLADSQEDAGAICR